MARFKFTKAAVGDLTAIWNYTFNLWSEEQADKYYKMLIDACKRIAAGKATYMSKLYDNIAANLRGFHVGKHIIFYRFEEDGVVLVIRILHEKMDLKSRINELSSPAVTENP
jgi:toxin ParE1/3/4